MSKKYIAMYVGCFIIVIVGAILTFLNLERNFDVVDVDFSEYYAKIDEENEFLNELLSQDYDTNNSQNPYIPDGFYYVTGTVETGFVIEDEASNQFVWVPCNSSNLYKVNFSEEPLISIEDCWEEKKDYQEFLKSSLENGGFYVSRFETGVDDEGNIVSKLGAKVLVDVERKDIQEKIDNMDLSINVGIINGFAYDRMLMWLMEDEDFDLGTIENFAVESGYSGRNVVKNIYDVFDSVFEITSENVLDSIVFRGYSDYYINGVNLEDNRYSGSREYGYADVNITSRLVLY